MKKTFLVFYWHVKEKLKQFYVRKPWVEIVELLNTK